MKLILLVILCFVIEVLAYPSGAPTSTCISMTPSHKSIGQTSVSVIRVSTVNENCYTANSPLNLQISGGSFKGFLVEARPFGGIGNPLGNFTSQETTLNCNSVAASAVTHTNGNAKTNVKFSWNVPVNPPPQITFRLTVVRDYSTFWLSVDTIINICQVTTATTPTTIKKTFITKTTTTKATTTKTHTTTISITMIIKTTAGATKKTYTTATSRTTTISSPATKATTLTSLITRITLTTTVKRTSMKAAALSLTRSTTSSIKTKSLTSTTKHVRMEIN